MLNFPSNRQAAATKLIERHVEISGKIAGIFNSDCAWYAEVKWTRPED
jgi:hypothetical protein